MLEAPLTEPVPPRETLAGLFLRFLRFGAVAWGGPAAQISMLRETLVIRERWISPERFNRVLAVYQALPGPEATELCCYFGMLSRGRAGSIVAGLGFMLPGLVLMLVATELYMRYGLTERWAIQTLGWCRPVVAGVVLWGGARLAVRTVCGTRSALHASILAAAGAAQAVGVPFWVPLAAGGAVAWAVSAKRYLIAGAVIAVAAYAGAAAMNRASLAETRAVVKGLDRRTAGAGLAFPEPDPMSPCRAPLGRIARTGLEAGLLTFGGAYTAVPVVEDRAVGTGTVVGDDDHWVPRSSFLDALSIASVLPAPMIIFTTMIGGLGGGLAGALVMTAGVFLPAFGFTLVGHRVFERVVEHPRAHALLDGVASAAVGVMLVTAGRLALEAVRGPLGVGLLCWALLTLGFMRRSLVVPGLVLSAAAGGLVWSMLR